MRLTRSEIVSAHWQGRGVGSFGAIRFHSLAHRIVDTASIAAQGRSVEPFRLSGDRTLDVYRQECTATYLVHQLRYSAPRTVLLIGDGYGVLGSLLQQLWPLAALTFVDLPSQLAHQRQQVPIASFVTPDRLPEIDVDLAVSVAAFQEFTPAMIACYFGWMRRHVRLFYCCSRAEKTLSDGSVIRFADYPWSAEDHVLDEGPCPWHQWFLDTRWPFLRRYDGRHVHRLVRLAE